MLEARRHFRLRHPMAIHWKVKNGDASGEGTISNISLSGLLMQTDKVFRMPDKCVLSIKIDGEDAPLIVKQGKVVWFRRINTPKSRYQFGVEFVKDAGFDAKLQDWLEGKVTELGKAGDANVVKNYIL